MIISVMVYLNKRLMYCANGLVILANIVRLIKDFDSSNSELLSSRVLAILVIILVTIISINIANILIQYLARRYPRLRRRLQNRMKAIRKWLLLRIIFLTSLKKR